MEIYSDQPSAPSGYYQIQLSNGSSVEVYCDMEGSNCGGEGGWTRVAYINMTELGSTCPEGLTLKSFSGLSLCGNTETFNCAGINLTTHSINYQKVCGRLHGYQKGYNSAFLTYNFLEDKVVDGVYLDGASITYGSPRTHIWSYAVGSETDSVLSSGCPCNTGFTGVIPPFVGNDYYCESGTDTYDSSSPFYAEDPLWDGKQCTGLEGPCCDDQNLPWFKRELNTTISDDIELRLCITEYSGETLLELIELYIL